MSTQVQYIADRDEEEREPMSLIFLFIMVTGFIVKFIGITATQEHFPGTGPTALQGNVGLCLFTSIAYEMAIDIATYRRNSRNAARSRDHTTGS